MTYRINVISILILKMIMYDNDTFKQEMDYNAKENSCSRGRF